jgi:hypothetical protein
VKKFIVSAIALSTLLWVGCGDDDDDDPPPVDNTVTVTANTTTAPATPLVYNDAVWNNVTATSITLSTGNALPVSPVKTPMGPDKSLSAPSTVDLQAIKKGGRLYLRFQWEDATLSMQREAWEFMETEDFNFQRQTHLHEDQLYVLFEDTSTGWDMWNWRVLTTGQMGFAEDGTIISGDTTWDAGLNRTASTNEPRGGANDTRPKYVHQDEHLFTGDVLLKSEQLVVTQDVIDGNDNWTPDQTVPGWIINDDVDWANITESRWDVQAVYNYDHGIGNPGLYTLVMVRDLTAHEDDLDMSELTRVKTRVGILDDFLELGGGGSSQRKFSVNFWLALP